MRMKSRNKCDTRSERSDKLKDANQKLKKENNQLRKYVKQLEAQLDNISEDEPLFVMNYVEPEVIKCIVPSCGGAVKIVPAGMFEIHVCEKCGKRRTVHNLKLDME